MTLKEILNLLVINILITKKIDNFIENSIIMEDSTYLHTLPKDILVNHICKMIHEISIVCTSISDYEKCYYWVIKISFFNAIIKVKGVWTKGEHTSSYHIVQFVEGYNNLLELKTECDNIFYIKKKKENICFISDTMTLNIPKKFIEQQLYYTINKLYDIARDIEYKACRECGGQIEFTSTSDDDSFCNECMDGINTFTDESTDDCTDPSDSD